MNHTNINIYRALKTSFIKFFIPLALLCLSTAAPAQTLARKMVPSGRNAEKVITEENLRADVEFLTDTLFHGRRTGTRGANEAAFWITRRFESRGLQMLGSSWSQSFRTADGTIGHNIVGFLPGNRGAGNQLYTIVAAHYDSFGVVDGRLLPGADSNASGVVAMLSIVDMFAKMKELGRSYGNNLIFVALDGREKNSAGAEDLWARISSLSLRDPVDGGVIRPDRVHSMVVLDILGSTMSPVHPGRDDYLMMLSDGHFTADLVDANKADYLSLDISFNYYGSKSFTKMFHNRIGDQRIFVENGVHCALFTSGITMLTNKEGDTADTLDYEIFKKRIFLIFHWFTKML